MEEIQIISKYKDIKIIAHILDGKIAMITDNEETTVNTFFSDNDHWIFALYKALKEVEKKGGFEHLKEDKEDIEKVYV